MTRREILEFFSQEIKSHEGWHPPSARNFWRASRSFRNKNEGNLRYFGQAGAIGKDYSGFAIFRTVEDGHRALLNDIYAKFTGNTRTGLNPNSTILQFFQKYAPASDNNNPLRYSQAVVNGLNVKGLKVSIGDSLGKLMSFANDSFKILVAIHNSANQTKITGVLGSFVQYLNNTFETKKFDLQMITIPKEVNLQYMKISAHVGTNYDLKDVEIVDMKQLNNLLKDYVLDHKLVIFIDGDGRGLTASTVQEIDGALVNQMNFIPFHEEMVFLDDLVHEFLHVVFRIINKSGERLTDRVHSYSSITDSRPEAKYTALIKELKPQWNLI